MAKADRRVFIDTWGWLSLEDRSEPAHQAVVALRRQHAAQSITWLTTDYILDEAITRLYSRRPFDEAAQFFTGIFRASQLGQLGIERITQERFDAAYALRLKLRDKPRVSFTDLTSFTVMRELGIHQVVTGDAHFAQVNLGFAIVPSLPAPG